MVYPNPVNDYLNIKLEIVEQGQYIFEVIYNIGRPVIREVRYFECRVPSAECQVLSWLFEPFLISDF